MKAELAVVAEAVEFAALRHAGQTRKGAGGRPYITHLAEVARLVAGCAAADAALVAAAYLHDVVEDGHAGQGELRDRFGAAVAGPVAEMTDDMSLAEEERKRRQVAEVAAKSAAARLLKLADKTSNVREMADDPPAGWSAERIGRYVDWAVAVVDAGCRGLDAALEGRFDAAVADARAGLGGRR